MKFSIFQLKKKNYIRNFISKIFIVNNEQVIPDLYHYSRQKKINVKTKICIRESLLQDNREIAKKLVDYGYKTTKSVPGKILYEGSVIRNCITGLVKIDNYYITETVLNSKRPIGFTYIPFKKCKIKISNTYVCNERNFYHFITEDVLNCLIIMQERKDLNIIIAGKKDWRFKILSELLKIDILCVDTVQNTYEKNGYFLNKTQYDSYINESSIKLLRRHFNNYSKNYINEYYQYKIYISRRLAPSRRPGYEEKVEKFLKKNGFVVLNLEKLTFEEQMHYFSNANILITPHGAGLTNILFMKEEIKIIEIFEEHYINFCFTSMTNTLNYNYDFFIYKNNESELLNYMEEVLNCS
jgi:hypothetical protein